MNLGTPLHGVGEGARSFPVFIVVFFRIRPHRRASETSYGTDMSPGLIWGVAFGRVAALIPCQYQYGGRLRSNFNGRLFLIKKSPSLPTYLWI